jgi:PQQ-dependent catabolism-associated CXXCW motif protein
MNRSRHSRRNAFLATALTLSCSFAVQAQQGFDQAPAYPAPPAQPSGYPSAAQMPPTGQTGYPSGPGMQQPPNPGMHGGVNGAMPGGMSGGTGGGMSGGMNGAPGGGNPAQAIVQMEMQDFGVPPQQQLQTNLHGPTPTSIPGGQVVTTDRLLAMYQQGMQNGSLLVFHVLGPGPTLPNAQNAVGASQAGTFQDQTQQQFGQYLQQVTQGNKAVPMVFYCQSTQCWMSYNAALRAINMGYTQVYWYRGGIEAWQAVQNMAMNANGGMNMQQGGAMQPPAGYQNAGYQPQPNQGGW